MRFSIAHVFVLVVFSSVYVFGQTAENVFKNVSPSVVLIKDVEGFGSGVVISETGLILTNFHVINVALALEVTAEVTDRGQRKKQTFKGVKIVGVHPSYDLALLKVDVGRNRLMPIQTTDTAPATGAKCFVIGNPSGGTEILRNSITEGIVSSSSREVEGQNYIQTSAAINPGNSGGALVNQKGQLLGIVTFKIDQTEGIGFAIPYSAFTQRDFKSVSKRKNNMKKALELEKAGIRYYDLAQRARGEKKKALVTIAFICFRMSLTEAPNLFSAYNNIGICYVQLGEYETAKPFLEKALELNPKNASALKLLGLIAQKLGDEKAQVNYTKRGMVITEDPVGASGCAENHAVYLINNKRWAEAAYCVKWADSLHVEPRRKRNRKGIYDDSVHHLTDAQFEYLSNKEDGFSFSDLERYLKMRGKVAGATPQETKTTPKSVTPIPIVFPPSGPARKISELINNSPDASDGLKKKLPGQVMDVKIAYGGAYLVIQFKDYRKLGIFNIAHARFDKFLPASERTIFAAGGRNLLTFSPVTNRFDLWDLSSMRRVRSRTTRISGVITHLAMGLNEPFKALLSYADSTSGSARRHYAILEIPEFITKPLVVKSGRWRSTGYRGQVHFRTDANFRYLSSWQSGSSPMGVLIGKRSGAEIEINEHHTTFGTLGVAWDGSRIYCSGGIIANRRGNKLKDQERDISYFPAYGGNFYLKHRTTKGVVDLFDEDGDVLVKSFNLPGKSHKNRRFQMTTTPRYAVDQRFWASAAINRFAFISDEESTIHVFELGVKSASSEGLKTWSYSGESWSQTLDYPEGTKIIVEDAPAAVRFDHAQKRLSWSIPAGEEPGEKVILLNVQQPGKEEDYRKVRVMVRRPEPGAKAATTSGGLGGIGAALTESATTIRVTTTQEGSGVLLPTETFEQEAIKKKKIPDSLSDAQIAMNGKYLVLQFSNMKKLAIFDIAEASIAKYITTPSVDTVYAAGGNSLIIYHPKTNMFELWDLSELSRSGSKGNRIPGVIDYLAMGMRNPNVVLASYSESTQELAERHYGILNPSLFTIRPIRAQPNFRNSRYRNRIHIRLSDDAKRFTSWSTSQSPNGFTFGVLNGTRCKLTYDHASFGALGISGSGRQIFASGGKLLKPDGNIAKDFGRDVQLYRAYGGEYYVVVRQDSAEFWDATTKMALKKFKLPKEMKTRGWTKNRFTSDRRVWASVAANRFAFVDNEGEFIYLYELGLNESQRELPQDSVYSGERWSLKLGFPKGTKLVIEDAPKGMQFDLSTNTLSWDVPADVAPGERALLVSFTVPNQDEEYKDLAVKVLGRRPGTAPVNARPKPVKSPGTKTGRGSDTNTQTVKETVSPRATSRKITPKKIAQVNRTANLVSKNVTIAELQPGTKVLVLQIRGTWIGVQYVKDGKALRGWIKRSAFE